MRDTTLKDYLKEIDQMYSDPDYLPSMRGAIKSAEKAILMQRSGDANTYLLLAIATGIARLVAESSREEL
jgi:hypothetical protein